MFAVCGACGKKAFWGKLNYVAATRGHYCNTCVVLALGVCVVSFIMLVFTIGYMWGH